MSTKLVRNSKKKINTANGVVSIPEPTPETKSLLERFTAQRDMTHRMFAARKEVSITPAITEELVRLISSGCTSREIETLPHMPPRWQVFEHKHKDPVFAARIDRAREAYAWVLIDDAMDIARGMIEAKDNPSANDLKAADQFVKTAVLVAEKMAPKTLGPLLKLGQESGLPFQVVVQSFRQERLEKQNGPELSEP